MSYARTRGRLWFNRVRFLGSALALPTLFFVFVSAMGAPAFAEETTTTTTEANTVMCEGAVHLDGATPPDSQWSDVLARLCADLRAMRDRDTSAKIHITPTSNRDLLVEVRLADGRSTIRRVTRPLALHAALEALLTLPPSPSSSPSSSLTPSPPSSPTPPSPPPPPSPPAEKSSPEERLPSTARTIVAVPAAAELSLSAAGRAAGAGYTSVGGVAEAYMVSGHWLFGLAARWEAFQRVSASRGVELEVETAAAGVGVARRIKLADGKLDLDIGFSPRLVVETQSWDRTGSTFSTSSPSSATSNGNDDGADDDDDRTRTDVRVATFSRLHFGRSAVRAFAGLDAELSPARLRRQVRAAPDLPAFPAWSAGVSLGVSWIAP